MKLRISLRGVLVTTAMAASFCYWRTLPLQNAERLVAAVEAEDYQAARAMYETGQRVPEPDPAGQWTTVRAPQSTWDWLAGRCYVTIVSREGGYSIANRMRVTATHVVQVGQQAVLSEWPRPG